MWSARAVAALGDDFDVAQGPPFAKNLHHRTGGVGKPCSIRPIKAADAGKRIFPVLGQISPKLGRGLIEEDDLAIGVEHVDGNRKRLQNRIR